LTTSRKIKKSETGFSSNFLVRTNYFHDANLIYLKNILTDEEKYLFIETVIAFIPYFSLFRGKE